MKYELVHQWVRTGGFGEEPEEPRLVNEVIAHGNDLIELHAVAFRARDSVYFVRESAVE